ncbi:hypothetical protein KC318_g14757 [Hortaea werneckii]|uniref:Exosome complex protein n=1 Tax=Hortaea werneckii TaxID=91943 RepID=A0A3M6Y6A0_HORWE|nr:hypothetical protein KC318_g14757 [Hortaea werneckii]RMX98535.1 hypothetical protein D0867_12408 [Hortaea werneckii]RMY21817.1 hypothetical protein D0866_12142 [Hortaea werneckii]
MDTEDLESLVEDFGGSLDDLEAALEPLLKTAISASTSKLPLLDKAKLYVLATYAIESILFSALRLNGVDAKSHPVFQDLNRVKEYFEKIKAAETTGTKRSTQVDKDAAGRFIKHGLAGNEKFDRERAERQAREKAGAKRKLEELEGVGKHTRFDASAKKIRAAEESQDGAGTEAAPEAGEAVSVEQQQANKKEAKRQRRLERKMAEQSGGEGQSEDASPAGAGSSKPSSKSSNPPRSSNETFQALLQGPLPKEGKKKKRKSKGQVQQQMENERADEMR